MSSKQNDLMERITSYLEQNTRANQIGIYTVAGIGLAFAIHKVRPLSKFSRAADVPKHFIKNREPLRGRIVDCEPSIHGTRLLFDHKPLVRIPLWHSSKPPLPVQVWGTQLVGGNGMSWLQVVAVGKEATITPLTCNKDALIGHVKIHWPIAPSPTLKVDKKAKSKRIPMIEDIEVSEKLIELGMAKISADIPPLPKNINYYWWTPWMKEQESSTNKGYSLQRAQDKAKSTRSGFWQDIVPPSRLGQAYNLLKPYIPKRTNKSTVNIVS